MYCIHCGKQLDDGSRFCIYCGGRQDAAPAPQPKDLGEEKTEIPARPAPAPTAPPVQQPVQQQPVQRPVQPVRQAQSYAPQQGYQQPAAPSKKAKHAKKKGGKALIIIPIAIVLLAAALAAAYFFVLIPGMDRANIDTVKNGYLGEYTDATVSEVFYDHYAESYDGASWAGVSAGLLKRDVELTFTDSEGDKKPASALFNVDGDKFRLASVTDPDAKTSKEADLIALVNSMYYDYATEDMSGKEKNEYIKSLEDISASAVLYGASADYDGSRAKLAAEFGEKTDKTTVAELLGLSADETNPGATDAVTPNPENGGETETPEENTPTETTNTVVTEPEPEPEPDPATVQQIADGRYWNAENELYVDVTHSAGGDGVITYNFDLHWYLDHSRRYDYAFSGKWVDEEGAIVYENGSDTRYLRVDGSDAQTEQYADRYGMVEPGADEGTLTWYDFSESLSYDFELSDRALVIPEVTASVRADLGGAAVNSVGTVTSATATSQIKQSNGIDNGPMMMFDGKTETSWQEGVEGLGIGESFTFNLDGASGISAMSFRLGNWRTDDYFTKNASPKTMKITLGGETFTVDFQRSKTVQYVVFSEPIYASTVTMEIVDVHAGTSYQDTCIAEIEVFLY